MIARLFKAIGWSALFGFAVGASSYVAGAFMTAALGPVFYKMSLTDYVGQALIYAIGGLIILGGAFLVSYLVWLRSRPPGAAIFRLAMVAFAVQLLEQGIVEMLGIRESHALSQPIGDQLMPFNIGLFMPVGIWEGRPDAAYFWFSAALAVFVYAGWSRGR